MSTLADRIAKLSPEQRAALLARLRAERSEPATTIPRVPRHGGTVGLSFTQERIWFLEQFAPGTALQNMSGVARIPMALPPPPFPAALGAVVARHEILRTSFALRDGEPVGIVADQATVPVRVLGEVSEEAFREDAR